MALEEGIPSPMRGWPSECRLWDVLSPSTCRGPSRESGPHTGGAEVEKLSPEDIGSLDTAVPPLNAADFTLG